MAHECPECGSICYCGGDIDDIQIDGTDEQFGCTHYLRRECDGHELTDDDYDAEMEAEKES